MTEKRFKLEVEDDMYYTIFDNQSIDEEDKLYGLDDEQVCDLLNELAEENEQLKSEINMLKITIGRNEGYINRLTSKGEWNIR